VSWLTALCCILAADGTGDPPVRADRPYAVTFSARDARFVRLVIQRSSSGQACIDELEVYAPKGEENLALAERGSRATASSCLRGYAIHRVAHLNDGRYGNDFSWIAATTREEWAQIELPETTAVSKVILSRDRRRQYADRVPIAFAVRLSVDGKRWTTVREIATTAAPVALRRRHRGFSADVPPPPPPPPPPPEGGSHTQPAASAAAKPRSRRDYDASLRAAILGEEHAWLKTYGRADLSPRLVPYNGRVKEHPRHVGDDVLPLPQLSIAPTIDGRLDDACWNRASRGVARVASPYDFDAGPLVEHAVLAGVVGDDLVLGIRADRLLSRHVAVVSRIDGGGGGVLAWSADGPVFDTYERGMRTASRKIDGAFDASLTCCEARLPLALFPDCRASGLRVGLGMGGKHTPAVGRGVTLFFTDVAVAALPACRDGEFRVRIAAAPEGEAVRVQGNAPGLATGIALEPGESRTVAVRARGPIGPEHELRLSTDRGDDWTLHLFRYDPLARTLDLMAGMVDRFALEGIGVAAERRQLTELRELHASLVTAAPRDRAAERRALLDAHAAKRRLFFRDPDLAPLERILFVKRHAFEPSHNYSVLLDSPWRPGGGVYALDIPRRDGRLDPSAALETELFDAGDGIARNPMASFDATRVWFAHRASQGEYFHVFAMEADGGGLQQITDGPFHDYWPCPLPDGGLAFVSTRCRARFLCWRPQAAVLFRMEADGSDIRPLSFANLSEWGPSVMSDGRIIWQRSEYIDKGADFSHTLWSIRPDGTMPRLVFGNTIIQPNGYANGREVPGSDEICCTLVSHFGDLNGPIALVDLKRGPFDKEAIRSITPEVPWPGMWPREECFRDPVPIATDYVLCSHAAQRKFGLWVIDRFGNRELLHEDATLGSMCPTPLQAVPVPPVISNDVARTIEDPDPIELEDGQLVLLDVYRGLEPAVPRGEVKYLRVVEEVRADLIQQSNGEYQKDHEPFTHWYATPVDRVSGPYGWPSYVAKATWGLAPVEADGSANFFAPAGKTLYLQALDEDYNELQRMRSVVQLQPGEKRSCVGCHEGRGEAPPAVRPLALRRAPSALEEPPWGAGPLDYARVVQPVWDAKCVRCHGPDDDGGIDLTATLDADRVPASYRTLISQGWIHVLDCGYNSGGNEKRAPLTFGTLHSKLWKVLDAGHYDVQLSVEDKRRIKCWTDMNAPLWPDYIFRADRPGVASGRRP